MPTGYTAAIKDGVTFDKFAMNCARAFGALITLRDEPGDAPIPDRFEPSDYHAKAIRKAEERLLELDGISVEDAGLAAQVDHETALESCRKTIAENDQLRARYEGMLKQVDAWQPPTPDHEELKKFMREQITRSIDFDCSNEYYLRNMPAKLTAMEWRSKQVEAARRDIAYHSKEHAEEVGRAASRTDWVKALRESLR
jgi:hypothetical protein